MSCQPSANDLLACFCLAVALFAGSLIPFFLLVDAEHLLPRVVREAPEALRPIARDAAISAAAFLLLLSPAAPEGATS